MPIPSGNRKYANRRRPMPPRDCRSEGLKRTGEFIQFSAPYEPHVTGPVDYFNMARSTRDNRKSTLDLIFDDGCW